MSRRVALATAALAAAACSSVPVVTTNAPTPPVQPTVMSPAPVGTPAVEFSTPPALGAPPALRIPPISTRQLANGLTIVVVEQHELPLADVILAIRTGGEADPLGHAGTASLLSAMLTEGTTSRTSLQVADQEAFLGVHLGAASEWERSTISLHTPTAQIDSALALFADVALHASLPVADLERVRRERLTALKQLRDEGPAIANRAIASAIFGAEHPYGRPLSGNERSVAAISRADLQRYLTTYYRPNNATLLVVGDVTPDDVARRAEALFGAWSRADIPPLVMPAAARPRTTTIVLIDKPGAAQSSFRLGSVGVPRSTRDYFAIQVMNTVLGGSFTSRLMQNLRETHGYTYGAGSGFEMRRTPGPFEARAEVVSAKSDSALVEFLKELRAIRDTVPAAELAKAKRYLQLGLPEEFETTGSIARRLLPLITYGIPLDFYESAVRNIGAVTQADVQRVARQYVDPEHFTIVIVGDRATIEPRLRVLRVGDIVLRDVRDVLGSAATP